MVETEHLIVRNASFADLDTFAEWESRDDVIEHFCLDHKRNLDTLTDDFHDVTHDSSRKWLTIMLKENRKPIGRIGINDIDPINNSMNLKIIYIGDACYRGKGYGSESTRAVLEYAFSEMNLHRVAIDHFLDDMVSEHLYDSIGFRKEGIMKKSLLTKVMALAMAAVMLFSFNTTSQAAAKKNIDTNDTISLWVGDSRTVLIYQDMNMRAPNGTKYRNKARVEGKYLMLKYRDCYAGRGTGYNLVRGGRTRIQNVARKAGRQNIVFASGVNDIYNPQVSPFRSYVGGGRVAPASPETLATEYWKLYESFISKYSEDHFYLLSVNPVYCTLRYRGNTVTNSKVIRFNKTLRKLVKKSGYKNVTYVDTYKNVFQKNGWVHKKSAYRYAIKYRKMNVRYMRESSSYQLHYTDSVDKKLFKYVNDFIKNDMNIKKAINQR